MTALTFPCTVFTTQRKMNDRAAADMRYGDLTASQLRKRYSLTDVSETVDPYSGVRLTPFNLPQSRFFRSHAVKNAGTCSYQVCAQLLFDEMRSLSWPFSIYSPYRQLINKMIDHMQYADGTPFSDAALDMALRNQLLEDNSDDSSLKAIRETINRYVDYAKGIYPKKHLPHFNNNIQDMILPKFVRKEDNFNGLGITIHDIYAVQINILSLEVKNDRWVARVQYLAQDHFGLDDNDIMKNKFRQFRFFRIWFVLQRYEKYVFKTFFNNLSATVSLSGGIK